MPDTQVQHLPAGQASVRPRKAMGKVSRLVLSPSLLTLAPDPFLSFTARHGLLLWICLDFGWLCQLCCGCTNPRLRRILRLTDKVFPGHTQAGTVNLFLGKLYPKQYHANHRKAGGCLCEICPESTHLTSWTFPDSEIFTGIAYLGIICGQLGFGFVVDRYGRKSSMLTASCIMIVGSALCAAAYGAHGSVDGMLAALIVYRFITGIGSTFSFSRVHPVGAVNLLTVTLLRSAPISRPIPFVVHLLPISTQTALLASVGAECKS